MGKHIGYTWRIVMVFAGSVMLASAVRAHDPSHQFTDWFRKQHNKEGYLCCNGSDAYYLGSDEWTRASGNYRVHLKGIWFDVEDYQMLRPDGGPNPTGKAILWYELHEFGFSIRCFTPEFES